MRKVLTDKNWLPALAALALFAADASAFDRRAVVQRQVVVQKQVVQRVEVQKVQVQRVVVAPVVVRERVVLRQSGYYAPQTLRVVEAAGYGCHAPAELVLPLGLGTAYYGR